MLVLQPRTTRATSAAPVAMTEEAMQTTAAPVSLSCPRRLDAPSVTPEKPLRPLPLQVLHSVSSEMLRKRDAALVMMAVIVGLLIGCARLDHGKSKSRKRLNLPSLSPRLG